MALEAQWESGASAAMVKEKTHPSSAESRPLSEYHPGWLERQRGDARAAADGAKDRVGKGPNEERRIIQGRHHVEVVHAERFGLLASLDVDLVKRFDVLGEEGNGNHQHPLDAFTRHFRDGARE